MHGCRAARLATNRQAGDRCRSGPHVLWRPGPDETLISPPRVPHATPYFLSQGKPEPLGDNRCRVTGAEDTPPWTAFRLSLRCWGYSSRWMPGIPSKPRSKLITLSMSRACMTAMWIAARAERSGDERRIRRARSTSPCSIAYGEYVNCY